MFYILTKNFGGRKHDRYFKSWDKAKEEMEKDIKDCLEAFNGEIKHTWDFFNMEKGFYVYEKTASFPNKENCTWSIVDGYFED